MPCFVFLSVQSEQYVRKEARASQEARSALVYIVSSVDNVLIRHKVTGNLTRVDIFVDVHRLRALSRLLRSLGREALAHLAEAPIVHGPLEGVAFPSESGMMLVRMQQL
jgi:hypothetical protein